MCQAIPRSAIFSIVMSGFKNGTRKPSAPTISFSFPNYEIRAWCSQMQNRNGHKFRSLFTADSNVSQLCEKRIAIPINKTRKEDSHLPIHACTTTKKHYQKLSQLGPELYFHLVGWKSEPIEWHNGGYWTNSNRQLEWRWRGMFMFDNADPGWQGI